MPRWQPPNTVLSQQHFSLQNGSPGRDIGRTCGTSLETRVQTKPANLTPGEGPAILPENVYFSI